MGRFPAKAYSIHFIENITLSRASLNFSNVFFFFITPVFQKHIKRGKTSNGTWYFLTRMEKQEMHNIHNTFKVHTNHQHGKHPSLMPPVH